MAKKSPKSKVSLNYEQVVMAVEAHLRGGRTPYLEGQPGVGKTTVGFDVVDRSRKKLNGFDFEGAIIVTPTMHNALDLRGFGYTADIHDSDGNLLGKETRFAHSTILPRRGKWLIIVDELPDCPIHEQSGFYQLLLEGKIGEYSLPDGSLVMGCGNSPEHRAASNDLSTAIRGRVSTMILEPDMACLKRHALRTQWSPVTISFIQTFPGCVAGFDPDDFAGGCTPRDLDAVSRIEKAGWPDDDTVSYATALGNLGNKWGDNYYAHRNIRIPDPDQVISHPRKAVIPESPEIMFAFSAAVAQRATIDNIQKIRDYSLRLTPAHEVGLMYDCLTVNEQIVETDTWVDFFELHETNI